MIALDVWVSGGFLTWSLTLLYAQAGEPIPNTILGALVGGFGLMTGTMVWIVKRLLDTSIPQMQTSFSTSLNEQQKIFQTILSQQTTAFNDNERELRSLFETKLKHERDFFAVELAELLKSSRDDRERLFAMIGSGREKKPG